MSGVMLLVSCFRFRLLWFRLLRSRSGGRSCHRPRSAGSGLHRSIHGCLIAGIGRSVPLGRGLAGCCRLIASLLLITALLGLLLRLLRLGLLGLLRLVCGLRLLRLISTLLRLLIALLRLKCTLLGLISTLLRLLIAHGLLGLIHGLRCRAQAVDGFGVSCGGQDGEHVHRVSRLNAAVEDAQTVAGGSGAYLQP